MWGGGASHLPLPFVLLSPSTDLPLRGCPPALGRASTLLGPQVQMLISPSRNILTPPEIKFPLGKQGSLKLTHEIDHHSLVTHLFSLPSGNDQIFRNYGQG